MYLYVHTHVSTHRDQKRVSELRKLELQMVVSSRVDAGNQTLVLCRNSTCSGPLGHLSSVILYHLGKS